MDKVTIQTENNASFEKFFFGEMAEHERFQFETDFSANTELLEEMRAFEADLIEQYVRGWMDGEERSKFEANFLKTEKRRQKVEFSRQLIAELGSQTVHEAEKESIWSKFGGWFMTPRIAFASAFSIIALVFGGWMLSRVFNTESTQVVSRVDETITDIAKVENAPVNADISNRNKVVPVISPTPTPQKTPETSKTPIPRGASNPVLALFAGTLRTGGEMNELSLPTSSTGATFQLNLKTVDYKQFQANVTDGNGNAVFRSGNLRPQRSTVNLFVPAKNLPKGDYRINLFGITAAGENESAADFQFRVN